MKTKDNTQPTKEVTKKVDRLLDKVDTVIDQQKNLAQKEEVILKQVAVEEKEDITVEREVEKVEVASRLQEKLVGRLKHHKLLFPLVVAIGVILVWRGLWNLFDVTPVISYSFISLALGFIILWAVNRMNSL